VTSEVCHWMQVPLERHIVDVLTELSSKGQVCCLQGDVIVSLLENLLVRFVLGIRWSRGTFSHVVPKPCTFPLGRTADKMLNMSNVSTLAWMPRL